MLRQISLVLADGGDDIRCGVDVGKPPLHQAVGERALKIRGAKIVLGCENPFFQYLNYYKSFLVPGDDFNLQQYSNSSRYKKLTVLNSHGRNFTVRPLIFQWYKKHDKKIIKLGLRLIATQQCFDIWKFQIQKWLPQYTTFLYTVEESLYTEPNLKVLSLSD